MTVWQGSASGGFVTASLLYSLKKGIVDGVAVVGNDPEKPWLPKVAIVSSKNDILEAMQSKYCVIPTLEIIRYSCSKQESSACIVAMPGPSIYKYKEKITPVGKKCGKRYRINVWQFVAI